MENRKNINEFDLKLLRQFIVLVFILVFYLYLNGYFTQVSFIKQKINIYLYHKYLYIIILFIFLFIILKNIKKKRKYIIYYIQLNNPTKSNVKYSLHLLYNYIKKNFKKSYIILSPKKGFLLCIEENKQSHHIKELAKAFEPDITLKEKTNSTNCLDVFDKPWSSGEIEAEAFVSSLLDIYLDLGPDNSRIMYMPYDNYYENPNNDENDIVIGYTMHVSELDGNTVNKPIRIPFSFIKMHMGIFGITGSGKTTTAAWVSSQLQKIGKTIVVIDWHGEYSKIFSDKIKTTYNYIDVSRGDLPLNPLAYGNIYYTLNILEDVFDLTLPQSSALLRLLKKTNIKSLEELVSFLGSDEIEMGFWEKEVRHALLRKLEHIDTTEGLKLFSHSGGKNNLYFPPGLHIIDVSRVESNYLKKMYVLTLLKSLYENRLRTSQQDTQREMEMKTSGYMESNEVFIVIDEAHNILPKKESNFVATMLAEARKYGLFLFIVTQSPSSINQEYLKNLGNKIVHSIRFPSDLKIIEELIIREPELIEKVPFLKPGEFIASLYYLPTPILGRIVLHW